MVFRSWISLSCLWIMGTFAACSTATRSELGDYRSDRRERKVENAPPTENENLKQEPNRTSKYRSGESIENYQAENSDDVAADWSVLTVISIDPQPKTRIRAVVYMDTVDELPVKLVLEKIRHSGSKNGHHQLEWSQVVDLEPMIKDVLQKPNDDSGDAALAWSIDNLKWSGSDLQFQLKRYPRKTHSCEVKDVTSGNPIASCR